MTSTKSASNLSPRALLNQIKDLQSTVAQEKKLSPETKQAVSKLRQAVIADVVADEGWLGKARANVKLAPSTENAQAIADLKQSTAEVIGDQLVLGELGRLERAVEVKTKGADKVMPSVVYHAGAFDRDKNGKSSIEEVHQEMLTAGVVDSRLVDIAIVLPNVDPKGPSKKEATIDGAALNRVRRPGASGIFDARGNFDEAQFEKVWKEKYDPQGRGYTTINELSAFKNELLAEAHAKPTSAVHQGLVTKATELVEAGLKESFKYRVIKFVSPLVSLFTSSSPAERIRQEKIDETTEKLYAFSRVGGAFTFGGLLLVAGRQFDAVDAEGKKTKVLGFSKEDLRAHFDGSKRQPNLTDRAERIRNIAMDSLQAIQGEALERTADSNSLAPLVAKEWAASLAAVDPDLMLASKNEDVAQSLEFLLRERSSDQVFEMMPPNVKAELPIFKAFAEKLVAKYDKQ